MPIAVSNGTKLCLAAARAIEMRRPIYRRSIARWPADVNAFRPLIEALGGDVAGTTGNALSKGSVGSTVPILIPDSETAAAERAETPDSPILTRLFCESRGQQKATSRREILIDAVKAVTIHNGLLRVDCTVAGPNNEERSSGTLLIPGNQRRPILRALTQAIQELDKKLREQAQQAPAAKAN